MHRWRECPVREWGEAIGYSVGIMLVILGIVVGIVRITDLFETVESLKELSYVHRTWIPAGDGTLQEKVTHPSFLTRFEWEAWLEQHSWLNAKGVTVEIYQEAE